MKNTGKFFIAGAGPLIPVLVMVVYILDPSNIFNKSGYSMTSILIEINYANKLQITSKIKFLRSSHRLSGTLKTCDMG